MGRVGLLAAATLAVVTTAPAWETAMPGWDYRFPRDHGPHPAFKTEWWYFTGNLREPGGRNLGYQLTFFRQGIIPPGERAGATSRFVAREIAFAHFAVSEIDDKRFHFAQRHSRGAFGEAGFSEGPLLAWIDGWTCELLGEHSFRLRAAEDGVSIDLTLVSRKPPVIHGADGISPKARDPARASHYYSLTRLDTTGTLRTPAGEFPVSGESWFDHEWATNQLEAHQTGWDWFSLQLDDGADLMLFQVRSKDGDPFLSGTFIEADGTGRPMAAFTLEPGRTWRSPRTGGRYPVAWRLAAAGLELEIAATFDAQELVLDPVTYWEGAIRARGTRNGKAVAGRGYLEMTGYGGPIVGLQAAPSQP